MEPEVHIVERYMQLVKGCLTMTNIRLRGGKEIDILAMHPRTGERYHIECRVTLARGFRLRTLDTQTAAGRKHRRGLDTLSELKFKHPTVADAVREIFGDAAVRRALVVWDSGGDDVVEVARESYGIEVWMITHILAEMGAVLGTKGYRDDVLRLLQLMHHSRTHPPASRPTRKSKGVEGRHG